MPFRRLRSPSESNVIVESVTITITADAADTFRVVIAEAVASILARAPGYQGAEFHRCVEAREQYVLRVFWDSIESHTLGFAGSPLIQEWRDTVGLFLIEPPVVRHYERLALARV